MGLLLINWFKTLCKYSFSFTIRTHNILFIGTGKGRSQDNDVLAGCDKEAPFVVQSGPVYLIGRPTPPRPLRDPFIWAFWAIIVVGPGADIWPSPEIPLADSNWLMTQGESTTLRCLIYLVGHLWRFFNNWSPTSGSGETLKGHKSKTNRLEEFQKYPPHSHSRWGVIFPMKSFGEGRDSGLAIIARWQPRCADDH